jgi:hypothetical protein
VSQYLGNVRFCQPQVAGRDADVRVDTCQGIAQRVDFWQADLVDKLLLPVEVGRLDDIEVGDDHVADADSGQGDGNRRAEAADPGNADRRLPDNVMYARCVSGRQQGLQFGSFGHLSTTDQDDVIAILENGLGGGRETVDDQQVRISFDAIPDRTDCFLLIDDMILFVDLDLHKTPRAARGGSSRMNFRKLRRFPPPV